MSTRKAEAAGSRRRLLLFLFGIPLLLLLARLPDLPTSPVLTHIFSLQDLPARTQARLEYVVFIPLSAAVVVLFRLTLGLHIFGLFRPILLAIAFRITGLPVGLTFLALVMTCIVLLRPLLRIHGMHRYAREAVTLGAVVIVMLIVVVAGARTHVASTFSVARFPIISLCLISENFARALYDKGVRNAVWRGAVTVIAGIVICEIGRIPGLMHAFLRYPELLVAQIGCVVAVAEFLDFNLFDRRSPAAPQTPALEPEYAPEVVP